MRERLGQLAPVDAQGVFRAGGAAVDEPLEFGRVVLDPHVGPQADGVGIRLDHPIGVGAGGGERGAHQPERLSERAGRARRGIRPEVRRDGLAGATAGSEDEQGQQGLRLPTDQPDRPTVDVRAQATEQPDRQ